MGTKLYPPAIGGIIPSFSLSVFGGTTIVVPFSMNKAVYENEIKGFRLKIKSVITAKEVFSTNSYRWDQGVCYFDLTANQAVKLNEGQFYKTQLAYIGTDDEIGYYSTVGVVKCTGAMTASIEGLETGRSNSHKYNYSGVFSHDDSTEKEYSYRFVLYDEDHNIIKDTGEKIHLYEDDIDTPYISKDGCSFPFDFKDNRNYYIQYTVKTNNQAEISSPMYQLTKQVFCKMKEPLTIKAELNYDEGYVGLSFEHQDTKTEHYAYGNFLISRACSDTDFTEWDELMSIRLAGRGPVYAKRKDFTIEQGKQYQYSLQQYNDYNMLSERRLTPIITADFEDMFLTDGERQLRVRFNPKVSSFKTTILEQKTETIGSKFPFFFRNSEVNYKEFPIEGLISYLMDEEDNFMSKIDLGLDPRYKKMQRKVTTSAQLEKTIFNLTSLLYSEQEYYRKQREAIIKNSGEDAIEEMKKSLNELKDIRQISDESSVYDTLIDQQELDKMFLDTFKYESTQLVGPNYSAERTFKLEVLDWLNNGKPKLFRSPAEGNYIVRLMNVSLSPEDTLGRMLHTFSCNAYECAEYNYENLVKYDILRIDEFKQDFMIWRTLNFSEEETIFGLDYNSTWGFYENPYLDIDGNLKEIKTGSIRYNHSGIAGEWNLLPARAYMLYFKNMYPGTMVKIGESDGSIQEIVIGATGSYYCTSKVGFTQLFVPENNYYLGLVHYCYYGKARDEFDLITDQSVVYNPICQSIGPKENLVDEINNIKRELKGFYYLDPILRDIIQMEHAGEFRKCYFYTSPLEQTGYTVNDFIYVLDNLFDENGNLIKYNTYNQYYLEEDFPQLIQDINIFYYNDPEEEIEDVQNEDEENEKETDYILCKEGMEYEDGKLYYYDDEGFMPVYFESEILPNSFILYEDVLLLNGKKFANLYDYILPLYAFTSNTFSVGNKIVVLDKEVSVLKDFSCGMCYIRNENNEDFDLVINTIKNSEDYDFDELLFKYYQDMGYFGEFKKFDGKDSVEVEKLGTITKEDVILKYLVQPYNPTFTIKTSGSEEETVDLTGDQNYKLSNTLDYDIDKISLGNGVYLNYGTKIVEKTYALETEEEYLNDEILLNYKNRLDYINSILDSSDAGNVSISSTSLKDVVDACVSYLDAAYQVGSISREENHDQLAMYLNISPTELTLDKVLDTYSKYLQAYKALLDGDQTALKLLINEESEIFKAAIDEEYEQIRAARAIYPQVYHNYIKRLEYLMKVYEEGSDFVG